jgi:hypothetical protein
MPETAGWIVWCLTISVPGLLGVLHCALSIPNAVRGTTDGPSPVPLVGELALIIAALTVPTTASHWTVWTNCAVVALWFVDYSCRGIATARLHRRR